ncbi:MAG: heme-binding protein [Pseudomonas sp.]
MSALTLQIASRITEQAQSAGRSVSSAPLTIAVLDAGGHLISLLREDGSSMLRPQIAIGKAWGAVALGKASRQIASDAQQRPSFIAAVNTLAHGNVVPAPGGVLIRDENNQVIGAIGISGDTSDIDEQCAVKGVLAVGLQADIG